MPRYDRFIQMGIRFSHPNLNCELDYPPSAPSGAPVDAEFDHDGDRARLRLSSADAREVYFHLDRMSPRTPSEGRRMLEQDIGERFIDAAFGNWQDAVVAGRPALAFTFRFADRVRRAYFLAGAPDEPTAYRVILDPRSPVNEESLATLRFRSG